MASPEKQSESTSTIPLPSKEIAFGKKDLRDLLFEIDRKYLGFVIVEGEIQELVKTAGEQLVLLESKYPEDKDVQELRLLYDDLIEDHEASRHLNLDTSFDEISRKMEEEIAERGVRIEPASNTILADTVKALEECGITPEYIVTTGNPKAKTVVYFMQIHPHPTKTSPKILEAMGVKASQEEIYEAIIAASEKGLIKVVYGEGISSGKKLDEETLKKGKKGLSYIEAGKKMGKRIEIVGVENANLLKGASQDIGTPSFKYRVTAHNIYIGENIAEAVNASPQNLSFFVMGAAHEKKFIKGLSDPLPISQAIAYHGVNVVVVDSASKYFDEQKAVSAMMEWEKETRINQEKEILEKTKGVLEDWEIENLKWRREREKEEFEVMKEIIKARNAAKKPEPDTE